MFELNFDAFFSLFEMALEWQKQFAQVTESIDVVMKPIMDLLEHIQEMQKQFFEDLKEYLAKETTISLKIDFPSNNEFVFENQTSFECTLERAPPEESLKDKIELKYIYVMVFIVWPSFVYIYNLGKDFIVWEIFMYIIHLISGMH